MSKPINTSWRIPPVPWGDFRPLVVGESIVVNAPGGRFRVERLPDPDPDDPDKEIPMKPVTIKFDLAIDVNQDELSPERRFWAVARAKRGPGFPDIETPIVTGDTSMAAAANAIRAFADIIEDKKP
jgi:hypothetical protein